MPDQAAQSDKKTLTESVLDYQQSGQGLNTILARLMPLVYCYPKSKTYWKEDDCGEFLLFIYPRLIRAVQNFQDQGKPFEWYLQSILRWQFKSYCHRQMNREAAWRLSAHQEFWSVNAATENSAPPKIDEVDPKILEVFNLHAASQPVYQRRFLFWILKFTYYLSDEEIGVISTLTGCDRQFLEDSVAELRQRMHEKEQRLKKLQNQRSRFFYRARSLEESTRRQTDPALRAKDLERLLRTNRSLALVRKRISRIPLSPTNRDIGEVLGVPKGTVDTALYWLKKRTTLLYADDQEKRYA